MSYIQLTVQRLEEEHALKIIKWCYSHPYDYYNFDDILDLSA
ncbi:MAG: hypothetical protein SW833_21895 [Cyanobacteriota bacterium]|nr:hypothetical protein [Cyanobacteriota bacterium]